MEPNNFPEPVHSFWTDDNSDDELIFGSLDIMLSQHLQHDVPENKSQSFLESAMLGQLASSSSNPVATGSVVSGFDNLSTMNSQAGELIEVSQGILNAPESTEGDAPLNMEPIYHGGPSIDGEHEVINIPSFEGDLSQLPPVSVCNFETPEHANSSRKEVPQSHSGFTVTPNPTAPIATFPVIVPNGSGDEGHLALGSSSQPGNSKRKRKTKMWETPELGPRHERAAKARCNRLIDKEEKRENKRKLMEMEEKTAMSHGSTVTMLENIAHVLKATGGDPEGVIVSSKLAAKPAVKLTADEIQEIVDDATQKRPDKRYKFIFDMNEKDQLTGVKIG